MNNNITFLIQRLNHFKTLGPLIDEALKQGLNVNLLIFQVQPDYIADEMLKKFLYVLVLIDSILLTDLTSRVI